ncbi:helix-turn-helix domain-containing protein [Hyphococcus lacteus]|uniref:Helix-turn-helix transcriptional regulator n=1 Tax=Hyphococcus lacteus TaxID=3143536 RepID=A0ABV3Z894_9PROT
MASTSATAISALALGIFLMGAVSTQRATGSKPLKLKLLLVLALLTALSSIPLIVAFFPVAYPIYMPLMLPVLMALPAAVLYYIDSRVSSVALNRLSVLHCIMPIMGACITLGYWLLPTKDRSSMFILGELPPGFAPSFLAIATITLILVWSVVSFIYLVFAMKRLQAYRDNLKNYFSNTESYSMRWVESVMVGLVTLWVLTAGSLVADNIGLGLILSGDVALLVAAGVLLLLAAFSPEAQSELVLLKPPNDSGLPTDEAVARSKYLKSALSPDRKERLSQRIKDCLSSEKLYLDPNLSLKKLSDHLGATTNAVSQTINEEIGVNFFDYMASWRAKAAKELLANTNETVLSISLEVGFNSRSTFYKAFKKETGLTPKAYRDQQKKL